MSQYGWPDCPADVRRQVDDFLAGLRAILDENLLGVYLHGSLAMGCFNPARSDIDLLIVTHEGMAVETKRQVAELVLRFSKHPCPIELSFLIGRDIAEWQRPTPFDFHYGESWHERIERALATGDWRNWNGAPQMDDDLAAHFAITRHRGVRLFGAPIAETFPVVPPKDYVDSIVGDFWWGLERIKLYPVYFVLNGCRNVAYLTEGLIGSKDEGGEWALRHFPEEFRGIVASALDAYRNHPNDAGLAAIDLTSFAAYLNEALRRHTPSQGS
jgi:streptomycin 3"-adenylyltransferase